MRPIFDLERQMLLNTFNITIPQDACWMDRMRVIAYTYDDGVITKHTLGKITVKGIAMSFKRNETQSLELNYLSFRQKAELGKNLLQQLEQDSLNLIREKIKEYPNHSRKICSSEGKDSIVTKHLVRKVAPDTITLFSNTSLDTAQTYKSIKRDPHHEIVNPPEGFYQWIQKTNFIPSKIDRACCTIFKEGAMRDVLDKTVNYLLFYGMRNSESQTRKEYEDEWHSEKWSTAGWVGVLPIRKWSEEDIWLYILNEGLDFNELYTYGYSRVGCIVACPFRTPYENIIDKHFLPTYYQRWQRILTEDFLANAKWTLLNCTLQEYLEGAWKAGVVRDNPTQEVIDEFAQYKGLDLEIASKYFNQSCDTCGKRLKRDESGLNMKYFGRNATKKYCMRHLAKELDCTREKLKDDIKYFRLQGCALL